MNYLLKIKVFLSSSGKNVKKEEKRVRESH